MPSGDENRLMGLTTGKKRKGMKEMIRPDKSIVFRYKYGGVGFGCKGMPGGTSIAVYKNGNVVQCEYDFGDDKPIEKKTLATLPELAESIAKIIVRNADKLSSIPNSLYNGTLDAPAEYFTFSDKKITACNTHRINKNDVRPEYYEAYKENIENENAVLDIYNEIAKEINKYDTGITLEIK